MSYWHLIEQVWTLRHDYGAIWKILIFGAWPTINKCQQYVFGQCFIWVTNCYVIKFILSYEGSNPAILRLQMCLMCWDVDIVHQPGTELIDADYWSCLGIDIGLDSLFFEHTNLTHQLWTSNPAPADLPMHPKNMPYYQGPCFYKPKPEGTAADTALVQGLLMDIATSTGWGQTHLSNVTIHFGELESAVLAGTPSQTLLNLELAHYAHQAMHFDWPYIPFWMVISHSQLILTVCPSQFVLHVISPSLDICYSMSLRLTPRCSAQAMTSSIIFVHQEGNLSSQLPHQFIQFPNKWGHFSILVTTALDHCAAASHKVVVYCRDDGCAIKSFTKGLDAAHWKTTSRAVSYLNIGDFISNSCSIITTVHSSCATNVKPLVLKSPPTVTPPPISSYIWASFDRPEHALGYGKDDIDFNKDGEGWMTASTPKTTKNSVSTRVDDKYYLYHDGRNRTIFDWFFSITKEERVSTFWIVPESGPLPAIFGIEFHHNGHTFVLYNIHVRICALLQLGW